MSNINVVARATSQSVSALPKFVIDNYEKFTNFLRAYYKWSASEGPDLFFEALKLANDVDLTIEEMLPQYRASYAKNLPVDMKADFRHFSKFLKEFYQLRGTEESYKIFFRAIFNEDASVFYPKIQVFKPSDAVWNSDTYLKVSQVSGNPFNLINKEIVGRNNGYTAIVSNVVRVGSEYDVYFEESSGEFELDETIESDNVSVQIVPIYKVVSLSSQQSWYDGSIIEVDGITLKVDKVNYGRVTAVNVILGGTGYQVDDVVLIESEFLGSGFEARVSAVNGSGAITSISVVRSGFGFNNENVDFKILSNGNGAILEAEFNPEFKTIKSISIIQNKLFSHTNNQTFTLPDGTQIELGKGVTQTLKYWITSQSEPSTDMAKIHDSWYYQDFSYEIQSKANAREYQESLNALLSISGLKMFVKSINQESVDVNSESEMIWT